MTEPSKNQDTKEKDKLLSEHYDALLEALECLYIPANMSGRLQFEKNWPDIAIYIMGRNLIQMDTDGSGDFKNRKILENKAVEKQAILLNDMDNLREKSQKFGSLIENVAAEIIARHGKDIAEYLYNTKVINKVWPLALEIKEQSKNQEQEAETETDEDTEENEDWTDFDENFENEEEESHQDEDDDEEAQVEIEDTNENSDLEEIDQIDQEDKGSDQITPKPEEKNDSANVIETSPDKQPIEPLPNQQKNDQRDTKTPELKNKNDQNKDDNSSIIAAAPVSEKPTESSKNQEEKREVKNEKEEKEEEIIVLAQRDPMDDVKPIDMKENEDPSPVTSSQPKPEENALEDTFVETVPSLPQVEQNDIKEATEVPSASPEDALPNEAKDIQPSEKTKNSDERNTLTNISTANIEDEKTVVEKAEISGSTQVKDQETKTPIYNDFYAEEESFPFLMEEEVIEKTDKNKINEESKESASQNQTNSETKIKSDSSESDSAEKKKRLNNFLTGGFQ